MLKITLSNILRNFSLEWPVLLGCLSAAVLVLGAWRRRRLQASWALAGLLAVFLAHAAQVFAWPVLWHLLSSAQAHALARPLQPLLELGLAAMEALGLVLLAWAAVIQPAPPPAFPASPS